jgi:hypothetical protein
VIIHGGHFNSDGDSGQRIFLGVYVAYFGIETIA